MIWKINIKNPRGFVHCIVKREGFNEQGTILRVFGTSMENVFKVGSKHFFGFETHDYKNKNEYYITEKLPEEEYPEWYI